MVEKINKYKGFYIGRFETSIDTTTKIAYSKIGVLPATLAADSGNSWYGLCISKENGRNKWIYKCEKSYDMAEVIMMQCVYGH